MFRPLIAAATIVLSMPAAAQDRSSQGGGQDWVVKLGGGALVAPEYPGSADLEFNALPYIDVTWRDTVFLNPINGLGIYGANDYDLQWGVSLYGRFERDEDESDRLRGLGDIDAVPQLRLFGRVEVGPVDVGAVLARDLGEGDGLTLELNVSKTYSLGSGIQMTLVGTANLGDDDYMDSWFGIGSEQLAARACPAGQLDACGYDADAGLTSLGVTAIVNVPLTESWSVLSIAGLSVLTGDAADSPVVEEEIQPLVGLFAVYSF